MFPSPSRTSIPALGLALAVVVCGCGSGGSRPSPIGPSPSSDAELVVQGNPESPQGATWTYTGTRGGVIYDLQGVLLKPSGSGPFPAVIISHGSGGNAAGYARNIAREMVTWGLVCIATNYTHAGGAPLGAPGSPGDQGASDANILRAGAALEILRMLDYVVISRVAAHGHSMGAFLTTALVGASPGAFRAASHTAGGVRPDGSAAGAAPTESQARGIRVPYQMHHGDLDGVVPLVMDERLTALLRGNGVTHELHVYPGAGHEDVSRSPAVLARVRAWYAAHGVL